MHSFLSLSWLATDMYEGTMLHQYSFLGNLVRVINVYVGG